MSLAPLPNDQSARRVSSRLFAHFPVLTYALIMVVILNHDLRVRYVAFAGLFASLAVFAHLKKLHRIVRVAFIVATVGAGLAAWFYGSR